jgi:hypothetical protein
MKRSKPKPTPKPKPKPVPAPKPVRHRRKPMDEDETPVPDAAKEPDIDDLDEAETTPAELPDEDDEEEGDEPPAGDDIDPVTLEKGETALYNPLATPITFAWDSVPYTLPARGIAAVPDGAADQLCGVENSGGTMSRLGVRRLYKADERYALAAEEAGLTVEEYAERRNAGVCAMADEAAQKNTAPTV